MNDAALRRSDCEIDTSGLMCPLPLLRLKKALSGLAPGSVIKVMSTDPASRLDFGVFCEQAGPQLLDVVDRPDILIYWIRKAPEV